MIVYANGKPVLESAIPTQNKVRRLLRLRAGVLYLISVFTYLTFIAYWITPKYFSDLSSNEKILTSEEVKVASKDVIEAAKALSVSVNKSSSNMVKKSAEVPINLLLNAAETVEDNRGGKQGDLPRYTSALETRERY